MKKHVLKEKEINRFNPDSNIGLKQSEVEYMIENGKTNQAKNPTNKSYLQIILGNVFTPFNILLYVIAIILLIVVGPKVITNLMFLLIIFFNILFSTVQECKSKSKIEKLKLLADSKNKVRRDGVEIELWPHEIVLDDVVVLSPGDQIPADCIILDDTIIEVNESLLTGESVPVKKGKGAPLYAGSFIVSGYAAVKADKVGNDTYLKSIENKAKLAKQPKSRLMTAINGVIRVMAMIAIPLALVVFFNELLHAIANNPENLPMFPSFWGEENIFSNAIFYGGTTITFMIPAGMALLSSIAMTTGVIQLSHYNTLAQNLYSVEALSRVNTLCLDKTGTLTDGTMMVESYDNLSNIKDDELLDLISSYQSAFKSTNQTSIAMINRFGKEAKIKIIDKIEFSSARKYSAVKFDKLGWYALGAPDFLNKDKNIAEKVANYSKNGLRVILFVKINEEFKDQDVLPNDKTNLALFILRDNIRPEVYDTMQWFKENDVDIKVISGDNIGTVAYISKQCGIDNYDKAIDLSTIKETDNFEEIVLTHSIFGRVTPDQKADIIAVLKKNGRVTGVTGDGLNDLLAFKQADCSIALANGAAATKNVANLILLDSNFANMKEAVFQGRRVVNNIQRSSSLFVMKDFLWMFITIMPILFGIPHMIQPTVMTIVNLFITGLASLFISLEPDRTRVKGNFYKNVVERAIVAGFYMFIPVLVATLYVIISQLITTQTYNLEVMKTVFGADHEITHIGWIPVISLCITISGFIIFFENCRPFTKFRKILFAGTLGIVLLVLYFTPEYYIISGTEMLKESGGILGMIPYMWNHLGTNATLYLYRTMTIEQVLFLLIYLVVAYPLYLFNNKYVRKLVNKLLFSKRDYSEE